MAVMFPSTGMQILSSLVHFLGLSVITHFLSRRLAAEELHSFRGLLQMTWPRFCIILVLLDSWLFVFSTGILIFGVGLELNSNICSAAIYLCIAMYATSKLFIYAYLIEKVHVVWAPTTGTKRFRSPMFIIAFVTVSLYAVVIALMLVGHSHFFRDDGACVIGLKAISSIPLLSYDLYINVFLTFLFIWPLFRSGTLAPRLRKVAIRTLIASGVALSTSTVNVVVLAVLKGHELGWVCLGSCSVDIILNAFAIFWVSGGAKTTSSSGAISYSDRERRPVVIGSTLGSLVLNSPPPQNAQSPSKLNFSHQELQGDPEIGNPSDTDHKSSILKSMTSLFRKDQQQEVNPLQITVTTEYELEPHSEIKSATSRDAAPQSTM